MISDSYTPEQYENDRKKLLRWLRGRPWGAANAEDLAQDAVLAQLERISNGKAPKSLYFLAKDAARQQRLLPRRGKNGEWAPCRSLEIDDVMVAPASRVNILFQLPRHVSPAIKKSIKLICYGETMTQAALEVGLKPDQLSVLFADLGRKISGKRRKIHAKPLDGDQLALFIGGAA